MSQAKSAEKVVQEIRRKTRRQFSAEPAGTCWHDAGHRSVLPVARLPATNRSDIVPNFCRWSQAPDGDWAAYLSGTHGSVWHDDGNRASRPGVLPTLQPTSR